MRDYSAEQKRGEALAGPLAHLLEPVAHDLHGNESLHLHDAGEYGPVCGYCYLRAGRTLGIVAKTIASTPPPEGWAEYRIAVYRPTRHGEELAWSDGQSRTPPPTDLVDRIRQIQQEDGDPPGRVAVEERTVYGPPPSLWRECPPSPSVPGSTEEAGR